MNFPPLPGFLLEYGLALMGGDFICLPPFATNMHTSIGSQAFAKPIGKPIPTETNKRLDDARSQSREILHQFHEVSVGRQQLNLFYLGDSYVIKFWKAAF